MSRLSKFRVGDNGEVAVEVPALVHILDIEPKCKNILAFDQTSAKCGWAFLSFEPEGLIRPIEVGVIRPGCELSKVQGKLDAASILYDEFSALLMRWHPQRVACETPPLPGKGMMASDSSLIAAVALRLAVKTWDWNTQVELINTNRAKHRLTGRADASKAEVKGEVLRRVPGLDRMKPCNQDTCDAVAIALTACEMEKPR